MPVYRTIPNRECGKRKSQEPITVGKTPGRPAVCPTDGSNRGGDATAPPGLVPLYIQVTPSLCSESMLTKHTGSNTLAPDLQNSHVGHPALCFVGLCPHHPWPWLGEQGPAEQPVAIVAKAVLPTGKCWGWGMAPCWVVPNMWTLHPCK